MWIFVEPLDVLLFRDAKPFSAGESFLVSSTFPPLPIPFAGAIRAKFLSDQQVDFADYRQRAFDGASLPHAEVIGDPDGYGTLRLRGPFLHRRGKGEERDAEAESFFPMPNDVFFRKEEGGAEGHRPLYLAPSPFPWPEIVTNAPGFPLEPLWSREEGEVPETRLIPHEALVGYLKGEGTSLGAKRASPRHTESRTGLELEGKSRTAKAGRTYTIEFVRLERDFGFLLEVEAEEDLLPDRGRFPLGGEGRPVRFERLPEGETARVRGLFEGEELRDELVNKLTGSRRFKLYLPTPALFRQGWLPDFLHRSPNGTFEGEIGSLRVRLVSAAVGKGLPVSGWDLARRAPRSLRLAVPAGSVYFLEKAGDSPLTEGEARGLFDQIHGKSLQAIAPAVSGGSGALDREVGEKGKIGFGLALLGCLPEEGKGQ